MKLSLRGYERQGSVIRILALSKRNDTSLSRAGTNNESGRVRLRSRAGDPEGARGAGGLRTSRTGTPWSIACEVLRDVRGRGDVHFG